MEDLVSAVTELGAELVAKREQIEQWLAAELAKQTVPFYCSVDLRVSDHKIAPVDANLFPGGFNNLAPVDHASAVAAVKAVLADQWPAVNKVALLVEHQTRNPYYAEHLTVLRDLLVAGGAEVRVAFLDGDPARLQGHTNSIDVSLVERTGDDLKIDGWQPDLVLLNHDQTGGVPAILEGVSTIIVPPLEAGWSKRRKSAHFFQYERVAHRFARAFNLDAWLLQAYFNVCNRVDVSKSIGLGCLSRAVAETIHDIHDNYARVGCTDQPFVALKADAGTYGMGVVMLEDAAAASKLNRRQRQNLSVIKDGASVRDILIQEGVPSSLQINNLVAEPVIYMVGTAIVGGFWRLNETHGPRANLNSRGMVFAPLQPDEQPSEVFYAQQVVARLALLATARELAGDLAQTANA